MPPKPNNECANCGCRKETHPIPECEKFVNHNNEKSNNEWEKELAILLQKISVEYSHWKYAAHLFNPIQEFIDSLLSSDRQRIKEEILKRSAKIRKDALSELLKFLEE